MENKKKIELLVGGMLIILLLILILGVLYFDSKENEEENRSESFRMYERHSKIILDNDFYYGEESSRTLLYRNGIYQEKASKNDFFNFKNRLLLENEYSFERTSGP